MTTVLVRSSRDPSQLRAALVAWLAERLGAGSRPSISELESTDANGMSSDTVMFDATWHGDDGPVSQALVARIAPVEADVPVFPSYDLEMQFDVIKLVHETTDVPIPTPYWYEPDPAVIGTPFFVMSRVTGRVPPDNLPYTFGDNWLFNASADEQQQLQDTTIDAIAALHEIDDVTKHVPSLERREPGSSPLRRHIAHAHTWYDMAAKEGTPSPLVERGFDWLEAHWPAVEGPAVLSWGDSRIGNVLYDGFTPSALLDWEMAGVGPAELDVAWLICAHRVLNDLAVNLGMPGMPHFMRPDDIVTRYEASRGVSLQDLDFYLGYAALQWAIVFLRTGLRSAHFTGQPLPADTDDMIYCRSTLESLYRD